MTGAAEDEAGLHRLSKALRLQRDLFLVFPGEVDKVVVFGSNKEGNCCLVEASALAVPFLDGVESALAGEIKHEKNSHSIVADKRKHVHKLTLATKIPNAKSDLSVTN